MLNLIVFLAAADARFSASSSSFKNGGNIPRKYAFFGAGGKNIAPQIAWENAPKGTKSFVVSFIDINPIAKRWVHWMVLNIPSDVSEIPEGGELPEGSTALHNSFRKPGYGGPQPPPGSGAHKYVFTVYALKIPQIPIRGKFLSEAGLLKILKGKILAKASFYGTYQR